MDVMTETLLIHKARCAKDCHQPYGSRGPGSTVFSFRGTVGQFLAVALTAALTGPALAASTSQKPKKTPTPAGSTLSGKIVGDNGKPIRGAVVVVQSLDSDSSWTSLPSDRGGRFKLGGLHYGWAEVTVKTELGLFLGDVAMNLPPGKSVVVNFSLLETRDKPASWWADRRIEPPKGDTAGEIAGMVQSSQKLTGVEYWKSPAGIAIMVGVGVIALAAIAAGGSSYRAPNTTN